MDTVSNLRIRLMIIECLQRYKQCVEAAHRLSTDYNQSYPLIIDESTRSMSASELTVPQISQLISTSMATIHQLKSPGQRTLLGDRSFEYAYKTFIPEIGWCLASPSEQFLLLFVDGQTVLIDGKSNRVSFHDRYRTMLVPNGIPSINDYLHRLNRN